MPSSSVMLLHVCMDVSADAPPHAYQGALKCEGFLHTKKAAWPCLQADVGCETPHTHRMSEDASK